jgi:hypothetical protein
VGRPHRTKVTKWLVASVAHASRVPLTLLFTACPNASYIVRVALADDRSRTTALSLPVRLGRRLAFLESTVVPGALR